jgi:hypothetical protein
MSLRPIDLQTLFMRQSELSREKAVLHDGMVQKQAVEQAESAEESLRKEERVNRTAEMPQGPEAISDQKDNPPGKGQERRAARPTADAAQDDAAPEASAEVVKDPTLGRNIDFNA